VTEDMVFAIFMSRRVSLREMIVERITRKIPMTAKGTRAESFWRKEDLMAVWFFGVITGKSLQ